MITISEVANRAQVSKTLVSRVINNKSGVSPENRERITAIIKELNYRPSDIARSLVLQKTQTIGVVMDDLCIPYFFKLINGLRDYGESAGYNVIFCSGGCTEEIKGKYINFFTHGRADGIIVYGSRYTDENIIRNLTASKFPFVLIENEIDDLDINNIVLDNFNGAYKATEHLIKLGFKNIRHFTGDMNYKVSLHRFNGFVKAMQDNAIPLNSNSITYSDFYEDLAYSQMKDLIAKKDIPDAIFFGADLAAFGAIRAIYEAGLSIPKDISIIGFDDDSPQQNDIVFPKLTTIGQPLYEMGMESIKLLIKNIENPDMKSEKIIFDPKLIIRETCN